MSAPRPDTPASAWRCSPGRHLPARARDLVPARRQVVVYLDRWPASPVTGLGLAICCPPASRASGPLWLLPWAIRAPGRFPPRQIRNLWGCIVGRPGMMAALAPVVRLEARALEEWTAAQGQWRAEAEIAKARAEARKCEATRALRKDPNALVDVASFCTPDQDEAPILRRYTVASATVEALAEKLIENSGRLPGRDRWCPARPRWRI
jgi:hypothetical protein